jgi:RNA polymerase-binding transcription factor DksA
MRLKRHAVAGPKLPPGVSPRWAWHYRFLRALRKRLLESGGERRSELTEPLEPYGAHPADVASEEFEHEFTAALWSAEQSALTELDDALDRIRRGRYGICEVTGRPIPSARLRAIPWTRYLAKVQQDLERYSARNPGYRSALRSVLSK